MISLAFFIILLILGWASPSYALDPCNQAECRVEVTSNSDILLNDDVCSWREALIAVKTGANFWGCIATPQSNTVQLPEGDIQIFLTQAEVLSLLGEASLTLDKDLRIKGHLNKSVFVYHRREDVDPSGFIYTINPSTTVSIENLGMTRLNQMGTYLTIHGTLLLKNVSFIEMNGDSSLFQVTPTGTLDVLNASFIFNTIPTIIDNSGQTTIRFITFRNTFRDLFLKARNQSQNTIGFSLIANMNPQNNDVLCFIEPNALITSHGYTLATDASCELTSLTDLLFVPVQNFGFVNPMDFSGAPGVQVITEQSQAVDLIPAAFCPAHLTDQRGLSRPVDGNNDGQAFCDAGAFEVIPNNPAPNNDLDNDGILNDQDNCPFIANLNQAQSDGDPSGDACDNCPSVDNPDQQDTDQNGFGDICDDADGDGIFFVTDNCPQKANNTQLDKDQDGLGDVCDPDMDGDNIPNEADNCPPFANDNQFDVDGDGIGSACEEGDAFEIPADPTLDTDNDGTPDITDNCPEQCNPSQIDTDDDSLGDACDPDTDNDGIANPIDNCPVVANHDQADTNANNRGDLCENAPLPVNENNLCPQPVGPDNEEPAVEEPNNEGSAGDPEDAGNAPQQDPGDQEFDPNPSGDDASGSEAQSGGGCRLNPQYPVQPFQGWALATFLVSWGALVLRRSRRSQVRMS